MAALIVWTAFASGVFAAAGLLAGAVRGGAGRELFSFSGCGASEARDSAPVAGGAGAGGGGFCFFSLAQVITMLVITRILLQFFLQQAGVMVLRVQRPELERPFKMPLYPLPPLVAMGGFSFILVNRRHALGGLALAAGIGVSGDYWVP